VNIWIFKNNINFKTLLKFFGIGSGNLKKKRAAQIFCSWVSLIKLEMPKSNTQKPSVGLIDRYAMNFVNSSRKETEI